MGIDQEPAHAVLELALDARVLVGEHPARHVGATHRIVRGGEDHPVEPAVGERGQAVAGGDRIGLGLGTRAHRHPRRGREQREREAGSERDRAAARRTLRFARGTRRRLGVRQQVERGGECLAQARRTVRRFRTARPRP
jgi:hypothetical protein